MRESVIEKYLVEQVKKRGGFTRKVNYQARKGAPDQWCFFPGGRLLMIECKAPGRKPEPLQIYEMEKLRGMGFLPEWVDSKEGVDDALNLFLGSE